jgi:hypothetical protein
LELEVFDCQTKERVDWLEFVRVKNNSGRQDFVCKKSKVPAGKKCYVVLKGFGFANKTEFDELATF